MMLRSSSTPILGSLLSSCSESPNHNHNHNHHPEFNSPKHLPKKLAFHQHQTAHLNLIPPSSYSFNSSPSINAEFTSDDRPKSRPNGFRRAQSEGNLEGLVTDSCSTLDEFNHSIQTNKKFPRKPNCSVLQTIPSFSVYNPRGSYADDADDDEEDEKEGESGEESEEEMVKVESDNFSMAFINSMVLQHRDLLLQEGSDSILSKMHLATGLGVMTGGFNGGGGSHKEYKSRGFGGEGGDNQGANTEEYYKKMVEENPSNPLFLRNYAQFLHQSKEDLGGAEEYYSRAILVDPGDGEILSQYAQLTWELHGDEERSSSYFERAVQASPEDSHVLAAYAGFLWETDEPDNDLCTTSAILHERAIAAATI